MSGVSRAFQAFLPALVLLLTLPHCDGTQAACLKPEPHCKAVDLSGRLLDDKRNFLQTLVEDFALLGEHLTQLESISFANNALTPSALGAIVDIVSSCPAVKRIDLSNNRIGSSGVELLFGPKLDLLGNTASLTGVNLNGNAISMGAGVDAITDALATNVRITQVDLSLNRVHTKSLTKLNGLLSRNRRFGAACSDSCHAYSLCSPSGEGVACACNEGWTGDGKSCELDFDQQGADEQQQQRDMDADIEAAAALPSDANAKSGQCLACHEDAKCLVKKCRCNEGYRGNGITCTEFATCSVDSKHAQKKGTGVITFKSIESLPFLLESSACDSLRYVHPEHHDTGVTGMALAAAVSTDTKLVEIVIDATLTAEETNALLKANLDRIESLKLSRSVFDNDSLELLTEGLLCPLDHVCKLRHLHLQGILMPSEWAVRLLTSAVKCCPSLSELVISGTCHGKKCTPWHFPGRKVLLPERLAVLDLSKNQIGNDGLLSMSNTLFVSQDRRRDLPAVLHLNLSGNQIGNAGVTALAAAMQAGSIQLRALTLRRNEVFPKGVERLMAALKSGGQGLEAIDLSINRIGSAGVDILLDHVAGSESDAGRLSWLHLDSNSIDHAESRDALSALKQHLSARQKSIKAKHPHSTFDHPVQTRLPFHHDVLAGEL